MTASIRSFLPTMLKSRLGRAILATVAAAAIAISVMVAQSPPASAHCDSRSGPVVTAAQDALDAGDVNLVLPYVKADQEAELTAAFNETMNVRKRGGPEVKALADEYFLETTVRLHRVGEGASYTGIQDDVELSPALEAAEKSLEEGKADEVLGVLDESLKHTVADRYQSVIDARAAEKAAPSVETARERAEAELMFEKYILGIETAINAPLHEEAADGAEGGHGH